MVVCLRDEAGFEAVFSATCLLASISHRTNLGLVFFHTIIHTGRKQFIVVFVRSGSVNIIIYIRSLDANICVCT